MLGMIGHYKRRIIAIQKISKKYPKYWLKMEKEKIKIQIDLLKLKNSLKKARKLNMIAAQDYKKLEEKRLKIFRNEDW